MRGDGFGLEPGEELRAVASVSFRGAAAASCRSAFTLGSARVRRAAYEAWRGAAEQAGFPAAGAEMILAISTRRILVHRPTFWAGRPSARAGDVPLARVAHVACARHGLVTSLSIVFGSGTVVEVEAMRGRPLARLARAAQDALVQRLS